MLLANIIYFPGTGGSFLRRALTLSDLCIMHDANQQLSAREKFVAYNNWNRHAWKGAENLHRPAYRTGQQEFWLFEQSHLYLIDAWHPAEFSAHDQTASAWQPGAWPWLIVITVRPEHRDFLERNQQTKSYRLDWHTENTQLQYLTHLYASRIIELSFDTLLTRSDFLRSVENIDRVLHLDLAMDLVAKLWTTWYEESRATWL